MKKTARQKQQRLTLSISNRETYEKVKQIAKAESRSISNLVNKILTEYVNKNKLT